jgi:DeoR family fructose operon transcriptional repressor
VFAEERQRAMAEQVSRRGRVSVTDLARAFSVTTETVRRDLSALESHGLVRRVHGGAIPADSLTLVEVGLSDRDRANVEAKQRIARAALRFLPTAGATLLFDAGSTTMRLAEQLPRERSFTAITHAVPIAERLAMLPQIELHMLPGRVRLSTHAAVGVATVAALARVRADVAFLGTNGISATHGLSTPDHAEAATKAALIASAHTTVLLCDSSKFGVERTSHFADLEDIDVLVTEAELPEELRAVTDEAGVEVVVA